MNNLQLSAGTIAKIFAGKITAWNDPAIRADNPRLALPSTPLVPVDPLRRVGHLGQAGRLPGARGVVDLGAVRSAVPRAAAARSSGRTSRAQSPCRGSDGMANYISNPAGRPGQHRLRRGRLRVRALDDARVHPQRERALSPGRRRSTSPSASKHATLNRDLHAEPDGRLPRTRGQRVSAGQLQLPDQRRPAASIPRRARCSRKWIIYIACAGQREAAPLGYSPLPPNLVQAVFSAVKRIPGAPTTPALTPTACPNPTITGQGYGGSPGSGTCVRSAGHDYDHRPDREQLGWDEDDIDDRRQDAGRGRVTDR